MCHAPRGSIPAGARRTGIGRQHMGLRAYGVTVLAAAAALWMMSGTQREKPVLAATLATPADAVRALESDCAAHPGDAVATAALAQAYLTVRQPGLAVGLVEGAPAAVRDDVRVRQDRKSTRLNSSHSQISYAVFCLKKK